MLMIAKRRYQISLFPVLLLALMSPLKGSDADETRSILDRWVETRKLISQERSQWKGEKEQLERTVELLETERARLTEDIGRMKAESGAADLEKNRLEQEDTELKRTLAGVETRTAELERTLPSLLAEFPGPLRERTPALLPPPDGDDASSPPLAQRLQAAVGFLGEADRFQENLHVMREVIIPEGGDETEVRVLYLGLGQAYYLGPQGDRAGLGKPGGDGWEWTPRNDLAPGIRRALAVYDNEAHPEFVGLPVTIRNP